MKRLIAHASEVSAAVVVLLFGAAFYSIVLVRVAEAAGWAVRLAGWARHDDAAPAVPAGLWVSLLVFLAASAVSAAASIAPAVGLKVVGKEVLAAGVAFAAAGVTHSLHVRRAAWALIAVAALAGCWGIYLTVVRFGGAIDGYYFATAWMKLPIVATSYGYLLAIAFAVTLAVGLGERGRLRALALSSLGLIAAGLVISFTRASWLAAALVVAFLSARRRAFVPILAGTVALAVVLQMPVETGPIARARAGLDLSRQADRFIRYRVGAAVYRDHPILGTGPGVLEKIQPRYALPESTDNSHLHNVYLQLLVERGPIGLAAWLVVMLAALARALRSSDMKGGGHAGLSLGIAGALGVVLVLGWFNYIWDDWRVRGVTLALIGLAWSPGVAASGRASIPTSVARGDAA